MSELWKNLLPNASFELDLGDNVPTNWGSEGPPTSAGFQYMPRLQAIRWRPLD